MPADETPRQKKQASYSCRSTPATLKSNMSLRTSSCSLGCVRSVELRPTASTLSTPSSRRHSRRTPCPTIPVAPKRITFMTAPLHSTQRLWLSTFLLLHVLQQLLRYSVPLPQALRAVVGDPNLALAVFPDFHDFSSQGQNSRS